MGTSISVDPLSSVENTPRSIFRRSIPTESVVRVHGYPTLHYANKAQFSPRNRVGIRRGCSPVNLLKRNEGSYVAQRKEKIDGVVAGKFDWIVATSGFGMGADYPFV